MRIEESSGCQHLLCCHAFTDCIKIIVCCGEVVEEQNATWNCLLRADLEGRSRRRVIVGVKKREDKWSSLQNGVCLANIPLDDSHTKALAIVYDSFVITKLTFWMAIKIQSGFSLWKAFENIKAKNLCLLQAESFQYFLDKYYRSPFANPKLSNISRDKLATLIWKSIRATPPSTSS